MAASSDAPDLPCPGCDAVLDPAARRCAGCGFDRVVLGRYRLETVLGRGGMATVYGARRTDDRTPVAVKLMRLAGQEDWKPRELFERSSKVLRQLSHPQLPRVYDFGELDDGSLVLVSERFDGGTLQSRVRDEHWRCAPAQLRALLTSLLRLLAFLHGRVPPVIHRDIKPSNVMFRATEDAGAAKGGTTPNTAQPVLVDFDSIAAPRRTTAGGDTVVFSPGYTAPEQLAGIDSPAADLYSVGMTILWVVTHRDPESLARDAEGRLQLGDALDPLDPNCRRVLLALVEPERRNRPASAAEALAMLERDASPPARRVATAAATTPRASPRRLPSEARPVGPWVLGAVAVLGLIGGAIAWMTRTESAPTPPPAERPATGDDATAPSHAPPLPPTEATPLRCLPDLVDCDGDRDNGCEVDPRTSAAHCGACGHACGVDQRCLDGACTEAVVAITQSLYGYCELRHGGALWCDEGDRGHPRDETLHRVELPRPVIAFEADRHRCAVTDDHQLYCWGENALGQAATGSGRRREPTPVHIETLPEVTGVALGRHTGCAVSRGRAHCWGSSLSFAVIGSPKAYGADTPIPVEGMRDVTAIESGPMHVCVLRPQGVWCWGDGRGGATGDPRRPQGSAPTKIEGLLDATALALGRDHSCALQSTGTVVCWGTNDEAQLGDGTLDDHVEPRPVVGLPPVVEIASEQDRTCARTEAGAVWCWGGSRTAVPPAAVELPGPARTITMGYGSLVALLVDGRVVNRRS